MPTGRRHWMRSANVLGLIIFAVCAVIVFYEALPAFIGILSPDSFPFFPKTYRSSLMERTLESGLFYPQLLYWFALPPLYAHELTYILDSLLLALGAAYYLRGRGAHPVAAWFGGLSLGFSGYTFTLFCAGHRGYFHMFATAVWMFGLLERGFRHRSLFHFAALGAVFAWGVATQPDVAVLAGAVAGAYALWLTFKNPSRSKEIMARTWPRLAIAAVTLAAVGSGAVHTTLSTHLAARDKQIEGPANRAPQSEMSAAADANAAQVNSSATASNTAAATAAKKRVAHERWVFATNWSLPPEDMLELVVPGIMGDESMQLPHPYWGRLGQPHPDEFQKGRMMPNYRGHTVYLGVLPVLFMLLGIVAWVRRGRARETAGLSDVPFWLGVWLVCLLLAMGRYTPLYRLFYALPYMDYIRAPVKFLHLTELSTALLAGFGMDALLRKPFLRRWFARCALAASGVFGVGVVISILARAGIQEHITSLGMGFESIAKNLTAYTTANLLRSFALTGGLAALMWGMSRMRQPEATVTGKNTRSPKSGGKSIGKSAGGVAEDSAADSDDDSATISTSASPAPALLGAVCLILCVSALDQASVARRFVRTLDVAPHHRANAATRAILHSTSETPHPTVLNYATPHHSAQSWFSASLNAQGIRNAMLRQSDVGTPTQELFAALDQQPATMWQALHVDSVILSRQAGEPFIKAGLLKPYLDFELGEGIVHTVKPSARSLVLAKVVGSRSGARALTEWRGGLSVDEQIAEVASRGLGASSAPSPARTVGSDSGAPPQLRRTSVYGDPWVMKASYETSSTRDFLLVFDERFASSWQVEVDGKKVPAYVTDGIWLSAIVPAGEHQVSASKSLNVGATLISATVSIALLLWGIVSALRATSRCESPQVSSEADA